jgi:hypothetical protein
MSKQRVAWDFDGTIHPYTNGWTGVKPDDEPPIPGAADALRATKVKGLENVIFSCRASHPDGVKEIQGWLDKYGLAKFVDGITDIKPQAIAYVDDRGVPFNGNYLAVLHGIDVLVKKVRKEEAQPEEKPA